MPVATIDGLEVYYETVGSGPPLLMFAPGGFDSTVEKWRTTKAWKDADGLETLSSELTLIVYDRRESGRSAGRVEKLSWELYARQAKGLMDHLKVDSAFVLGGCMGCSLTLAFAVKYPAATQGLLLHWPVGGCRWKMSGRERFTRHLDFAREKGLRGIIERAREKKTFWEDAESGPWASVIARDSTFAEAFDSQDLDRYLGVVATSGSGLFDRDTATGAEPEEIMGIKVPALIIPGDDPSHATSAAHYLRECLPHPEFCNVMPPEQTTTKNCEWILEFCRAHR